MSISFDVMVKLAVDRWFDSPDPRKHYLYYRPSTLHRDGELVLVPDGDEKPAGFFLADPVAYRGGLTIQAALERAHDIARRLPILVG